MLDFTVITAAWNAEEKIGKCLESVRINQLEQTEHLILDNLSSDGTCRIVKNFSGTVLLSEKDSGIYNAMNKGIHLAKNEVLVFLNTDDSFLPETLRKVRDIFEQYPESDIVYGNLLVNDHEVKPPQGIASFRGARIFHPATFIRRTLFDKLGEYNETYRICADLDFFLRAKNAGAVFTYTDQPLTNFSLGGVSTTMRKQTALEVMHILKSHGYSGLFSFSYFTAMRLRNLCAAILYFCKKLLNRK